MRLFTIGLFGAVFFLFFDLAVEGGLAIDAAIVACIGVSVIGLLRDYLRERRPGLKGFVWRRFAPLLIYLILDVFGFFFSGETSLFWEKYRVVALLIFLAVLLLQCTGCGYDVLFLAAGLAAFFTTGLTLIRYFSGGGEPLLYLLRFSLRRDYNMYATVLLIGWICLTFWLLGRERFQLALCGSLVILPVLLLSGSRRVLLALPVALLAATLAVVASGWSRKRAAARIALLLVTALLVLGQAEVLARSLAGISNGPQGALRLQQGGEGTAQTSANQRYETIGQSTLFSKRMAIWHVAIDALFAYTPREWLLGRGGGESIRLYDRVGGALDAAYPDRAARKGTLSAHNMLLADLLDGGLLKALALCGLVFSCGWGCLRLLRADWRKGLAVGVILGFVLLSNLVSNRYGLLYDRGFLLFYPLLLKTHLERKDAYESSNCNGDHPSPT